RGWARRGMRGGGGGRGRQAEARGRRDAMRLIFFGDYRLGLVLVDQVHDVTAALGEVGDLDPQERLQRLIERYDEVRDNVTRFADRSPGEPVSSVPARAPVPSPCKLLCAARNYREHGFHDALPIEFFLKSPEAILDPEGTVELPPVPAKVFQHEAELAAVIGRTAKNVPADQALQHVFAYTTFCDVSARGLVPGN